MSVVQRQNWDGANLIRFRTSTNHAETDWEITDLPGLGQLTAEVFATGNFPTKSQQYSWDLANEGLTVTGTTAFDFDLDPGDPSLSVDITITAEYDAAGINESSQDQFQGLTVTSPILEDFSVSCTDLQPTDVPTGQDATVQATFDLNNPRQFGYNLVVEYTIGQQSVDRTYFVPAQSTEQKTIEMTRQFDAEGDYNAQVNIIDSFTAV